MKKKIAVLKGDGIGPEIVNEALKVLDKIAKKYNHEFETTELYFGGASIDKYGEPLTDETLNICKNKFYYFLNLLLSTFYFDLLNYLI